MDRSAGLSEDEAGLPVSHPVLFAVSVFLRVAYIRYR